MKVIIERGGAAVNPKRLQIEVGGNRFTVTETPAGGLVINKYNEDDFALLVQPRCSNEIEIK